MYSTLRFKSVIAAFNVRLSKTMKKILVAMLKDTESRWWTPIEIARLAKPEATYGSGRYLSDPSVYRTLSTLAREGYLAKEERPGPYQGTRLFKLTEKGRETALQIKTEVQSFIREWRDLIEEKEGG